MILTRAHVTFGLIAVLMGALVVAWSRRPELSPGPCVLANGPALLPELPETSGLAVSRRSPGLLWSHNDSGHDAMLFAVDAAGVVHGRVRAPFRTRDWEDVSASACPAGDCLYLADIGDNGLVRPQVFIYRVPEPLPGDTEMTAPEVYKATYTDGPHNAEALFVIGEHLFIVTRDRTGVVYSSRLPGSGGQDLTFERIGALGLRGVSDAETSSDGRWVVVRTSRDVVVYSAAAVIDRTFAPHVRIPVDGMMEPQGEGVAMTGDLLYLSSEGNSWNRAGRIIGLRCDLPE